MSDKTKIPELNFEFTPTTPGVPKFKVRETLFTVTRNNPTEFLINTRSYMDADENVRVLNNNDVEALLKVFGSFLNECIVWNERKVIESKNKAPTSYILAIGITGGNIIAWSLNSGNPVIAIITFIIGAILTLPLSEGFTNV